MSIKHLLYSVKSSVKLSLSKYVTKKDFDKFNLTTYLCFHKANKASLAFKVLLLLLFSCGTTAIQEATTSTSSKSDKDYFPEKADILYAENFTVSYHGNYKVLKTKVDFGRAAQDSDSVSWAQAFTDKMVLVQKGTATPELTGELKDAHVIEIPVSSVVGNADDAPTRFLALKVTDKLLGLGHAAVYDLDLRKRFVNGELKEIGASWHTGPNLEMLAALQPELAILTMASLTQADGLKRTRDLKLKAAPDFSWSETSYLGQLEWIKYDALFFNAEAEANRYFEDIKSRCDSLASLVAQVDQKPGAMWGMHSKSGNWTVRSNGGIAELIKTAGANNPFEDSNAAITDTKANGLSEGITFSDEIILQKASDVDFIFSFQSTTGNWPPDQYMSAFPAYANDQLYHHFKRFRDYGAHDWYQTAPMRPDLLLSDLIKLFHPEVLPDHEFFFMAPIEKVN